MSMARRVLPWRLALNSPAGSSSAAPLAKVSFTTDRYGSPVQMIPSWDQVGTPGLVDLAHFSSSTTPGTASRMRSRTCCSVDCRQPPRAAILAATCCEPWVSPVEPVPFTYAPVTGDSSKAVRAPHEAEAGEGAARGNGRVPRGGQRFGDHLLDDRESARLPRPSLAKGIVETVHRTTFGRHLGRLTPRDFVAVEGSLREILGL